MRVNSGEFELLAAFNFAEMPAGRERICTVRVNVSFEETISGSRAPASGRQQDAADYRCYGERLIVRLRRWERHSLGLARKE
jgi:hypothetical protein